MSTLALDTAIRPWSPSASAAYRTCPRKWSYGYGPHKTPYPAGTAAPLPAARGRVLHAALAAAYEAATVELATVPGPLTGARMDRYFRAARIALGEAWERERMPSDPAEALECVRTLTEVLQAQPVPAPGAIYAVERRIRVRTPGGLLVTIVPDLVLWRRRDRGVLRVRDWKSGTVTPHHVQRSQQLLIYAGLLAEGDPAVTAVDIELYSLNRVAGHVDTTVSPDRIIEAIDRLERTAAKAEADTDPQPKPGPHCGSCPHRRICPAT